MFADKATIFLVSKFIFAKLMETLIIVAFRAFIWYNFLHKASYFLCFVFLAETLCHRKLDASIFI